MPVVGIVLALTVALPAFAAWPVKTTNSYFSQFYSTRHPAVDIAARKWTPVIAAQSGVVSFVGYKDNCGGRQVWIGIGNHRWEAYYHLANFRVHKGQRVVRGQAIGWVGETGCATGPHLHFEQWHGWPWAHGSYRYRPYIYILSGPYLPSRYR